MGNSVLELPPRERYGDSINKAIPQENDVYSGNEIPEKTLYASIAYSSVQ